MSTGQLLQKPDIKLSVKQTFGFDSDMKVGAFSKKTSLCLKWTLTINLIKIQH